MRVYQFILTRTRTNIVSHIDTFNHMLSRNDSYLVLVIEDVSSGRVVGSGTLMIEQKFVRKCGKVGHIEDIVVHDTCRGKQFGKMIIEKLKEMGKRLGW